MSECKTGAEEEKVKGMLCDRQILRQDMYMQATISKVKRDATPTHLDTH